ncbi:hypothetical protein RHMOL_Rhmol12G0151600 [Rhododendron molle]|uniref:Uncharacterized protein n=1 Tax=Rhododendron molle TaxID=49168 RepID=A0ACC0LJD1_RHOML|nr:hypothetical protein RHMOL_Rhmol12G0151600 [Rhododendron molle]
MAVARWWYDANIPFNATLSLYYQPAIDAILAVGPGFKGPSFHDLRCPPLNNSVREIREHLLELREVTRYIYNHAWVLNTMRKDFTNGRNLCRPASQVSEPLVRVLRLTDGDEKPVMGYLYDAMDKAKEAIKVRFNNRLSLYGPYIREIDARWNRQLHSPLNAAGCFLNPAIYFKPSFKKKKEVDRGMIQALTVLVPDEHLQDQISAQIEEYKQARGDFNMPLAIRQREKLPPVSWWGQFRGLVLELQRIIRPTKDALDPISLENIDVLDDWVSEEPSLLNEEDIAWEIVEPPSLEALRLDEDDQEPNVDDASDDPYVYVE